MKKKLLAILLTAVLVVGFVLPAMAADPNVTATYNKKTETVTITAYGVTEVFTKISNNTTKTFRVGEYDVVVTAKNDVATIVSVEKVVEIVDTGTPAAPAPAGNNGNQTVQNVYDGVAIRDYNNAQFHCNAISGNGRVWTTYGKDQTQKMKDVLYFSSIEGTTSWKLDNDELVRVFTCEVCGSTQWVTFSNNSGVPDGKNVQMQHPGQNITIAKSWIKNNDPYADDVRFFANFAITLENGKVYNVTPGSYLLPSDLTATVVEKSCTPGFELVGLTLNEEDVPLGAIAGVKGGDKIVATNEDEAGGNFSSEFEIAKTVDGAFLVDWAVDNDYDIFELISGITFKVFKAIVDGNGNPVDYDYSVEIGETYLGADGLIRFFHLDEEINGWYAIVEYIEDGSLAAEVFDIVDPLYVYFTNGTVIGGIGVDFEYSVLYRIDYTLAGMKSLGLDGLNGGGEVFPIAVVNTVSGDSYPSYCAHAGSKTFAGVNGCAGYMCALAGRDIEAVDFDTFLSALNYIEDVYGSLNDNRVVTQVVTWTLLGTFANRGVLADVLDSSNLDSDEVAAILDVIENSVGYKGEGTIVDIVYLTCEQHGTTPFGFDNCQPQLVPIYGEYIDIEFDNKPLADFYSTIEVIVDVDVIEEFIVQTHKDEYNRVGSKESTIINKDGVPVSSSNSHFKSVLVGVDSYELAYGNNSIPIGISYTVEIVDNELYIYFDADDFELIGNASMRAIVSNTPIVWGSDTNGQHRTCGNGFENAYKALKFDAVDLSGDKDIYLFVHIAEGLWAYDMNDPHCVLDENSAVDTRDYEGEIVFEVSFDGGVTKYEFNSIEYFAALDDFNFELDPDIDVTVTLYINGTEFGAITLTTIANEEIVFEFEGTFTINEGNPVKIVDCDKDYCPGWIG